MQHARMMWTNRWRKAEVRQGGVEVERRMMDVYSLLLKLLFAQLKCEFKRSLSTMTSQIWKPNLVHIH